MTHQKQNKKQSLKERLGKDYPYIDAPTEVEGEGKWDRRKRYSEMRFSDWENPDIEDVTYWRTEDEFTGAIRHPRESAMSKAERRYNRGRQGHWHTSLAKMESMSDMFHGSAASGSKGVVTTGINARLYPDEYPEGEFNKKSSVLSGLQFPRKDDLKYHKEDIGKLQKRLKQYGYDLGKTGVDKIWGKKTETAYQQYKKDWYEGLGVEEIIKKNTYNKKVKDFLKKRQNSVEDKLIDSMKSKSNY